MKSIIKIAVITVFTLFLVQCGDKATRFEVKKGQIGKLTNKTQIHELKSIFAKDSIVTHLSEGVKGNSFLSDEDKYLIYEKGGKHLLTIVPLYSLDSTSVIRDVQIFDPRYKTEKGMTLNSKFEDINTYYNITSDMIQSVGFSVKVDLKDLNADISFDKEKYTSGITSSDSNISPEQIDAKATIKSFVVWFNQE